MKNKSAGKAFGEEVGSYPDMACAGGELDGRHTLSSAGNSWRSRTSLYFQEPTKRQRTDDVTLLVAGVAECQSTEGYKVNRKYVQESV